MAYRITTHGLGWQPIATTDTTQNHPLGTIVTGWDTSLGGGEFIYLLGVASTVVGSIVNYRPTTFQTALGYVGENVPSPLAIAMSANVASQYGWYQISGVAVAAKSSAVSFAAGAKLAVGSSSGLAVATISGQEILGAVVAAVASAASGRTTVSLMVNRLHCQGRVT
jgi:hypothetical protein